MPTSISETILSNGMKIFCLRDKEVATLYEQIQEYIRNGIELHEGDTVFDVGANIGLFTIWVYQLCNKNVNIYAFEPIPAIFEVLKLNAQRIDPEKLKVFFCGLSQHSQTMTFAYYPNATPLCNAYPEDSKEIQRQLKGAILRNFQYAPPSIQWLRWLPSFLRSPVLNYLTKEFFQIELVKCQVKTLSDIIKEHNVQQIDLLKIDVEKSELEVFLGIEEQDWLKIKQVVVEVHDLDNRVEKIMGLLNKHGLNKITVEQEPIFQNSNIFNLYALRQ
ncbi:MAG: FkbM family methyltransferase [Scytonema sp. PMC 1069.18]|nr:FkbM family methyltransferase [Scytonema sp. PMC 1069.18]MEC4884077.1 FkbM family methyltransferase [Scytonema sp. PMC 1070.18]